MIKSTFLQQNQICQHSLQHVLPLKIRFLNDHDEKARMHASDYLISADIVLT